MEFRADLHCHTTCSDGTLSPAELIDHAKKIGLSALSITDHDTTAAYPQALESARNAGIEMIAGIEFSCVWEGHSVHILGYGFDPAHATLQNLCLWHQNRRKKRYHKMLELLAQHGMPLEAEQRPLLGRPHIAQAMVDKGYVDSIQEAFHKWIGENKPCFNREEWKSVEESIAVIHEAGGLAIIAHPHLIKNSHVLQALLQMPFDGIECYYARFPTKKNAMFLKIAKKKGWKITGGSDFHGSVKPKNPLGSSWVSRQLFEALHKR